MIGDTEMTSQPAPIVCDFCGAEVEPDPRIFVEDVISQQFLPGEEWQRESFNNGLTDPNAIAEHFRLTPEQLQTLLRDGEVTVYLTICLDCQDNQEQFEEVEA